MKLSRFIVSNAAEAVSAVRAELGPDAVVVSVKQLPQGALGWLSGKSRLEVTACIPDPDPDPEPGPTKTSGGAEAEGIGLNILMEAENPHLSLPASPVADVEAGYAAERKGLDGTSSRNVLETMGLLPRYAEGVLERVSRLHPSPNASLPRELALTRTVLAQLWQENSRKGRVRDGAHVFVGPPGVGKTTALCKWLTQVALSESSGARAWRLDGASANQAESLSVYCEILDVPLERRWGGVQNPQQTTNFIDLPGVSASEPEALKDLAKQIDTFGSVQVHLVLNAAYTTPLLFKQLRAFSSAMPVADLIFTHLDEETSWGKLWNFVIGTNFAVRSLSAGQNIPGYFVPATVEHLLPSWFPK